MANDGTYDRQVMLPRIFGPKGEITDVDAVVQAQIKRPGHSRAFCKVYMNGQDITSALDPLLLSLRVTDRKFGASEATLTIDDSYGKVPNPPDGAQMYCELGWPDEGSSKTFFGTLTNVASFGQRQTGRGLDVTFTSYDQSSQAKTPITGTWGEGKDGPGGKAGADVTFETVAKKLAEKAGLKNFQIAPSMASKTRKFWEVSGETPLGALERLTKELGGSFKVDGQNAGIADPSSGQAADGSALTALRCVVGENVLAWRVIPSVRRAQWGSLWHGFFDRDAAAPRTGQDSPEGGFGFGQVVAKRMGLWPTNDADMAKSKAKADTAISIQKRGTGWVVVDGMPKATAGGQFILAGMKPGVDGQYGGEEIEHQYFRGGGYVTRIDVEDPNLYNGLGIAGQWQDAP